MNISKSILFNNMAVSELTALGFYSLCIVLNLDSTALYTLIYYVKIQYSTNGTI